MSCKGSMVLYDIVKHNTSIRHIATSRQCVDTLHELILSYGFIQTLKLTGLNLIKFISYTFQILEKSLKVFLFFHSSVHKYIVYSSYNAFNFSNHQYYRQPLIINYWTQTSIEKLSFRFRPLIKQRPGRNLARFVRCAEVVFLGSFG